MLRSYSWGQGESPWSTSTSNCTCWYIIVLCWKRRWGGSFLGWYKCQVTGNVVFFKRNKSVEMGSLYQLWKTTFTGNKIEGELPFTEYLLCVCVWAPCLFIYPNCLYLLLFTYHKWEKWDSSRWSSLLIVTWEMLSQHLK